MKSQKIEITSKTIIFSVFFVLFLFFLWQIKELLISFVIGFIIAGALSPFVEFFEKKKISRSIASIFVYLIFIFVFFNLFYLVILPLISEVIHLIKTFPSIENNFQITRFFPYLELNSITNNIPNLANNVFGVIRSVFSNVFFVISTLFFGYYILADNNFIKETLRVFYSDEKAEKISHIIFLSQKKASLWFWAEIFLMTIIGVLTFIGLTIFNVKYALPLSVIAGLLEIVPTIGPIVSAIPAVIIGLSSSLNLGIIMVFLYIIIQQLENNLIVPVVMKKIVGLHPIITLIALMIGSKFAGVIGAIIAVPTIVFLKTFLLEWQKLNN